MNIVGFGDSFIYPTDKDGYMNKVGEHFGVTAESRGVSGTGPWYMFFDFLNYKKHIDVAIIAWSEICRTYHSSIQPLTVHHLDEIPENISDEHRLVYEAMVNYHRYIYDHDQKNWEYTALMCMFDTHIVKQYPDTKFIHLPCFSKYNRHQWWGQLYKNMSSQQLEYFYDFKNGVEIRPALMYLSYQEDMPRDLSKEHRPNHLAPKYHELLANSIIENIEHYTPGNVVTII